MARGTALCLCQKYGKNNIILEQGVTYNEQGAYWQENEPQIQKAVAAASRADVIVACIGENTYCETPGNLSDLTLSQNQRDLVKALAKTGKPVVLVLNQGRPRIVADIEPLAKAVVNILLPSNSGGDALANLLSGDANFSGRLPYSYPKEVHSLMNYDYKPSEHTGAPMEGAYNYNASVSFQWEFGYGLSYTTFEYLNMEVSQNEITDQDTLTVDVLVTNTGSRAGKTVVQLYVRDVQSTVIRPVRELKGFEKVELEPGEIKKVSFTLDKRSFAYWNEQISDWHVETGDFLIEIGQSSRDICLSETVKVVSTVKLPRKYTMDSIVMDLMEDENATEAMKPVLEAMGSMFGNQGDGSEAAQEAISNEMTLAMIKYMPLRGILSFGGGTIELTGIQGLLGSGEE